MDDLIVKLAGISVSLPGNNPYLRRQCARYITETGEVSFAANASEQDIRAEEEYFRTRSGADAVIPSGDKLLSLALYRQIAEHMTDYDTLLFHGSAVAVGSEAYLFCAESGTGKSTHAKMWRERFGGCVTMINDDKPLIRVSDEIRVYGTPWSGKHHLDTNTSAVLAGISILQRDSGNHIERIPEKDAFGHLLRYCYRSSDPARMKRILALLSQIVYRIPVYILGCTVSPEAAETAYEGMRGK